MENGVFEEIDESGENSQSIGKNKIVILFYLHIFYIHT